MTARILLVHCDEPSDRALAAALRGAWYAVRSAPAAAAPAAMAEWRPDAVVLEAAGGPAALGFCRALGGDVAERDPVLLALLASDDAALRLALLECGFDDAFAGLGFDRPLLLARLAALLRMRRRLDGWRPDVLATPLLRVPAVAAAGVSVVGARALVIDDDETQTELVQQVLAGDGLVPGRVADAEAAAALAAVMGFDLLMVSLSLLGDDPLRVVAGLRAADATRAVPILLLSAAPALRACCLQGLALGADDCLPADADPAELRIRARHLVLRKLAQDRLRADLGQAMEMALTDPLTGCYNRAYLARRLRALLAEGPARTLTLLLVDVDRFKAFNDRLGHAEGDAALAELARTLRQHVRGHDSLVRAGGEEFAVIMPETEAHEAAAIAGQLRRAIEATAFQTMSGETGRLTVSIGIATTETAAAMAPERLLHMAAHAAARAHAEGGNRVAAYLYPQTAEPQTAEPLAAEERWAAT